MKDLDSRPRWKHRCPGCNRLIHWEKVYCIPCIKKQPQWGHYRLSRKQTWLKGRKLSGIDQTLNHMFAIVGNRIVCVECGRKTSDSKLKHRCFFKLDSNLRNKSALKCAVCVKYRPKALFPIIRTKRSLIKVRVCTDCLEGSKLVTVPTRPNRAHA